MVTERRGLRRGSSLSEVSWLVRLTQEEAPWAFSRWLDGAVLKSPWQAFSQETGRHYQPLGMKFIQTVVEHAMACSWPPAGWPQLQGMMDIMLISWHGHRLVPSSCPSGLLESLPVLR